MSEATYDINAADIDIMAGLLSEEVTTAAVNGDHYWCVSFTYKTTPGAGGVLRADLPDLRIINPPHCLLCGERYDPDVEVPCAQL